MSECSRSTWQTRAILTLVTAINYTCRALLTTASKHAAAKTARGWWEAADQSVKRCHIFPSVDTMEHTDGLIVKKGGPAKTHTNLPKGRRGSDNAVPTRISGNGGRSAPIGGVVAKTALVRQLRWVSNNPSL